MFKNRVAKPEPSLRERPTPWRVLVVDDEPEVHTITRLTLSDVEYQGRGLEFVSAHSAQEAYAILANNDDFALAFIDVVMESDAAGLDLVTRIRTDLNNHAMRLILRTGQPGMAPERKVVHDFDINDYVAKTQVTADKLYTTTLAALRAYNDIITLKQAMGRLEQYRNGLEAVIDASSNLFEQRSLSLFASGLLRQLGALLNRGGSGMLVRAEGITLVKTMDGFEVLARAGRFDVLETCSSLPAEVMQRLQQCVDQRQNLFGEDFVVGYFPTKSGIINLLYLDGVRSPDQIDVNLLKIFSRNISIAFENLYLDREIMETQSEVITRLGEVVETRSKEAGNHVKRVARLAYLLAQAYGLSEEDCQLVSLASPMHDVGKVAIADSILLKPGPLDAMEWDSMKRHAQIGEQVFSHSNRPILTAAATIAGQHHEKWDGSGYPRGLKGEDIHVFARIVTLVDVFDALTQRRCYKESWPHEKVRSHILEQSGRHFDPQLVQAFIGIFDEAIAVMHQFPDPEN